MPDKLEAFLAQINFGRYHGQPQGHYESYFLRANHPSRPLAFWIRYTVFSPKSRPEAAIGELWAIFFDGETRQHAAAKQELPLRECAFSPSDFNVRIGEAALSFGKLRGSIQSHGHAMSWALTYSGESQPVLLQPFGSYQRGFPPAKSLVALPLARFNGGISVDGRSIDIIDWVGSQNHNWGSRHTDHYAWGQVAGFDMHPGSFLEVATARLRMGPFWLPAITPIVLRHNGIEHRRTGFLQAIQARGAFDFFTWSFSSRGSWPVIQGTISAPREAFVGLQYYNPPGGVKQCLNTKIASCVLQIIDAAAGRAETLEAKARAAFEILTDDETHGVPIAV